MITPEPDRTAKLCLRILATTDLHAHLIGWDYYGDRACDAKGFARVASLLRAARGQVVNCLYFDNGDLIEGSPLAEYVVAMAAQTPIRTHPMIAALNDLDCDAATLGNHEFSYGLDFLTAGLQGARYPVVTANILAAKGRTVAEDRPLFAPWAMLDRQFVQDDGTEHTLRVGVLGLTPPQVLDWEKAVLGADLLARDMVVTAAAYVPLIRAAGADLVVVLAHTGLGTDPDQAGGENVGLRIARLPGVDAVVLGHEHQVIAQGKGCSDTPDLPHTAPMVMPGAFGSHLGVMDLELVPGANGKGWQVATARVECRPVSSRDARGEAVAALQEDAGVLAGAASTHTGTRAFMLRPVGTSPVPLHSYFAVAHPDAMHALIAEAQAAYLASLIADTAWEGLPVLSAVAPFKTGGRGGPDYFTNVQPGSLLLRNAADLYVHPNRFAALVLSGADLRIWLERAASTYAQVRVGRADQPLLNPLFPATGLEMIAGLTYRIDLSSPATHASPAGPANGSPGRIRDLCHQGRPLEDNMRFALATNSHRLGVVLGQTAGRPPEVIADGTQTPVSRDVLLRYLSQGGPAPVRMGWSFCAMPGTTVTLDTSPAALTHMGDIAHLAPDPLGLTEDGFLRFRLHL